MIAMSVLQYAYAMVIFIIQQTTFMVIEIIMVV